MINDFLEGFALELSATLAIAVLAYLYTKLKKSNSVSILRLISPKFKKSGLVATHRSMLEATPNIIRSIKKTDKLKIISSKGTDWVGDDHAILSSLLTDISSKKRIEFKMLLLDEDSSWFTEDLAISRGKPDLQFFKDEFNNCHRIVEHYFKENKFLSSDSGVKYYKTDPIWRLLITDNRYFISSYATTKQARDSTVLEFKGPDNDLYQGAKRYFSYLWLKNATVKGEVSETVTNNIIELSGGAVVYGKFNNKIKLLIIEKHNGKYTLPKGHINKKETIEEGTLREITEETGLDTKKLQVEKNIGWYPNPIKLNSGIVISKVVYYNIVYYVEKIPPQLRVDEDHKSAQWINIETIDTSLFAYSHMRLVIEDAKKII